jgi:hypothetical protein
MGVGMAVFGILLKPFDSVAVFKVSCGSAEWPMAVTASTDGGVAMAPSMQKKKIQKKNAALKKRI